MIRELLVCGCVCVAAADIAHAGVGSKLVQEALEFGARKLGKEAAEEGVERVGRRAVGFAAKQGAEVLSRPSAAKIVSRFGDDGAEALLRHGKVGEEVIESFGETGAKALRQVSDRNGRRLAMMAKDGTLKPELLDVVRQHGDEACDFIWANKGALAVGATLTTFVTSPEAFLDGSAKLTGIVADAAVRPIAEIPKVVLAETLGSVTGLIGFMSLAVIGLGLWLLWNPDRRRWAFRTARGGFLLMRVSSFFRPATTKGA